ncbi:Alpha/Beta hydrolase protein [Hypoxylon trugodes]|uniref:Alpha/Beta hydrolase protein n=1 Tax=Hypoxylon trugodes TaxID=326681 RepID=UPI00218DF57D|nr:Alpha/Beta hydrolase protein [Hypoxylon trugodes]KAI1392637.1 Alpha/Beta hydrolase protein [Hypoxylon trugodes]
MSAKTYSTSGVNADADADPDAASSSIAKNTTEALNGIDFPPDSRHRLLLPNSGTETVGDDRRPLVICFHGSGESCSPSWDGLVGLLRGAPLSLRVFMYDRREENTGVVGTVGEMWEYLRKEGIRGPYVVVAHSYGGAFARGFVETDGDEEVVGVVLVETGQEGGLDAEVEERQYGRRILGTKPLSVVRGNSLIRQWEDLRKAEAAVEVGDELKRGQLRQRRGMLEVWDKADEEMKRKQLGLVEKKGKKRFVQVPDCGHHVVRDRPDVVAEEVAWVLENVGKIEDIEDDDNEDGVTERNREDVIGRKKKERLWGVWGRFKRKLLGLKM